MAAYADIGVPPGMGNFENFYLNNDPTAGWWNYLTGLGLGGLRPLDRFAQQNQSRYYGQYQAQAAQNPNEGFYNYLLRTQPNVENDYMSQSPNQRFDFSSRTYTPRVRFSPYGG